MNRVLHSAVQFLDRGWHQILAEQGIGRRRAWRDWEKKQQWRRNVRGCKRSVLTFRAFCANEGVASSDMTACAISTLVNNPKTDVAACIDPVEGA